MRAELERIQNDCTCSQKHGCRGQCGVKCAHYLVWRDVVPKCVGLIVEETEKAQSKWSCPKCYLKRRAPCLNTGAKLGKQLA